MARPNTAGKGRNHTTSPRSSTINEPPCPAVPCALVATSATGGLRSGRERKDHAPSSGADEAPGKGKTLLGMRTGPTSGVRTELTPAPRPSTSQPARLVPARNAAPAAVRNRRRVTLLPIAKLYTNPDLPCTQVSKGPVWRQVPQVGTMEDTVRATTGDPTREVRRTSIPRTRVHK